MSDIHDSFSAICVQNDTFFPLIKDIFIYEIKGKIRIQSANILLMAQNSKYQNNNSLPI